MREVINFNTKWAFTKEAAEVPQTMPEKWYWVNLPHSWNANSGSSVIIQIKMRFTHRNQIDIPVQSAVGESVPYKCKGRPDTGLYNQRQRGKWSSSREKIRSGYKGRVCNSECASVEWKERSISLYSRSVSRER